MPLGDHDSQFRSLLSHCAQRGASDLHLSAEEPPYLRVQGRLERMDAAPLPAEALRDLVAGLLTEQQQRVFEARQTLDFSYALDSGVRFRINVFRERGRVAAAVRRLEQTFHTLQEWGLPEQLGELAGLRDGLVIVTGPTGSGKTTTLSTLIHQINLSRAAHIITIEDPVEYVHANRRCLVRQRELYTDVPDFAQAVRASLREDPDVILVGEMRDAETIRAAITAAETGHLVFTTLHTGDAVGVIDRMTGVFTGEEQQAIRHQLSMVLQAVVAQRLMPAPDGGRAAAVEVLQVTPAIGNLIRTDKPQQIYSLMETGAGRGMQTLEQSLAELVTHGKLDESAARSAARDLPAFEDRLRLTRAAQTAGGGA